MNEILAKLPSVFQEQSYHGVSNKYVHVKTIDVINKLNEEGWVITGGSEQRVQQKDRQGFQKHMLMFRHQDYIKGFYGEEVPEIVLINSHDGSSAYNLLGGLFRFICSNGMIVPNMLMQEQHIVHMGDIIGNVIEGVYTVIDELPKMVENINRQKELILDENERVFFAESAEMIRWNEIKIDPLELLKSKRMEEDKPTLWNTFNILQEKLLYGGSVGNRRVRVVNSIDKTVNVNRGLWELSNTFLEA